jgi:uncharacterized protein YjbI with pentapeptide repeats
MVIESACFGSGKVESIYLDCTFDDSRFSAVTPGIARFERCSFRNVDVSEFLGMGIEMVDCKFSGIIRKGSFNGAVAGRYADYLGRTRNEFRGNDFSAVRLGDFDFRTGIDLTQQVLPDGWINPS